MTPILGSALAGIQQAGSMAASSAAAIARAATPSPGDADVTSDLVSLTMAGADVRIGAAVLRAEHKTRKALLDIVA
jgi:hypothetical protein